MVQHTQRYVFIDLLRFFAIVLMIQGHTFDALLGATLRASEFYLIHDFFHGFTAPMFLFASGAAFGVATLKKWNEHIAPTKTVARRFGRFFSLLAIGYALHLPFFSLAKTISTATPTQFAALVQVDVLQCIAVTLLILQSAVFIFKDEKIFFTFVVIAFLFVIFISPIFWSVDFREIFPLWLASYFNQANNSWFPLFPYSAYIFCGVIFARFFLRAQEKQPTVQLIKKTALIGVCAVIIGYTFAFVSLNIYPPHDMWKSNPAPIFARIGVVALLASGVFFLEHFAKLKPRFAQIMGRESLFIYILHLVILYGSVLNKGIQQYLKDAQIIPTYFETSAAFVLVFFAIMLCAVVWNIIKMKFSKTALALSVAAGALFIILFLVRPY